MSLKENILKKIIIKKAASEVTASLSLQGDSSAFDRKNAVILLEAAGYRHEHIRDLDLYYKGIDHDNRRIVVLDAEFAVYNTSMEDVVTRKSPTVKEMISIKNIRKILWDSGVILKKKVETVDELTREATDCLDLSVKEKELEDIMYYSMASLAERDMPGTLEGLGILAELLEWTVPPVKTGSASLKIFGRSLRDSSSGSVFGPAVSFSQNSGRICFTEKIFAVDDPEQKSGIEKFMSDCENACIEGDEVFRKLCEMVKIKYKIKI